MPIQHFGLARLFFGLVVFVFWVGSSSFFGIGQLCFLAKSSFLGGLGRLYFFRVCPPHFFY